MYDHYTQQTVKEKQAKDMTGKRMKEKNEEKKRIKRHDKE